MLLLHYSYCAWIPKHQESGLLLPLWLSSDPSRGFFPLPFKYFISPGSCHWSSFLATSIPLISSTFMVSVINCAGDSLTHISNENIFWTRNQSLPSLWFYNFCPFNHQTLLILALNFLWNPYPSLRSSCHWTVNSWVRNCVCGFLWCEV